MAPSSLGGSSRAATGSSCVASVLRDMYGSSLPRAAAEMLRDQRARSSSAPAAPSFCTGLGERADPKRARPKVAVPRVGNAARQPVFDGRPPLLPGFGKKMQPQILQETGNYAVTAGGYPVQRPARDAEAEKLRLQEPWLFAGGAAGRGRAGGPADTDDDGYGGATSSRPRRNVRFSSAPPPGVSCSDGIRPRCGEAGGYEGSGLDPQQEALAAEIVSGVRDRQRQLDTVESQIVELTRRAEEAGAPPHARRLLRKQLVEQTQSRNELSSGIRRDLSDLGKLLELEPDSGACRGGG
eukprot:TRINITY_DN20828_c0_g1_i1.p1 TRINITY_DN20828_c0_g1~~TRINITY_DN20828_c0_g1_i1.p1  ORF type:complete len:326 (-),score=73.60 TRINITY_DN20828_c0_g1_i1:73-960(-)